MQDSIRFDKRTARQSSGVNRQSIVLAAILLVALLLRLAWVGQPLVDVFSWREASTAMMADNFAANSWNIFLPEVSWTGPGPGYQGREFQLLSYIAALVNAGFGWHDRTGRLIAALFGVGTTFAVHRLTARVWDEPLAHAAALSYAIMPATVLIDSSFLPDPGMLALVTAGVWLLVAYSQSGGGWRLVAGVAAVTLGILAKPPGMCVLVPVVALIVALRRAGRRRAAAWMSGLLILGLMCVASYFAWAVYLGSTTPPYHTAGSGYIWELGLETLLADVAYLPHIWFIATVGFYGWPFLILIGVGLWSRLTAAEMGKSPVIVRLPLLWLGGAVLVYLVAAKEVSNNPWNLHIFHVPLAMLAGRGLMRVAGIGSGDRPNRLLLHVAVIAVIALTFGTAPRLAAMKAPYAEAGRQLGLETAARAAPDDLVVAIAHVAGNPTAVYYSRRRGWVFPPGGGDRPWSVWWEDGPEALATLAQMQAQGARWFGYVRQARDSQGELFTDHYPQLIAWLDAHALRAADTEDFVLYELLGH